MSMLVSLTVFEVRHTNSTCYTGYEHDVTNSIIESADGHKIATLRELVDRIRGVSKDQDSVTLHTLDKLVIVLPAPHLAEEANTGILQVYRINSPCSADLRSDASE